MGWGDWKRTKLGKRTKSAWTRTPSAWGGGAARRTPSIFAGKSHWKVGAASKRRRRQAHSPEEIVTSVILLLIILSCPFTLTWFSQRPWAIVLGIITLVPGMLGLIALLITWQQMVRAEQRRRLRAEDDWLKLTDKQFEEYVAELFRALGYHAQVTGRVADGGVDVRLEKDGTRAIVQCKRYSPNSKVKVEAIREFAAVVHRSGATEGYFVTTSSFTGPALDWAKGEPITMIDGDELAVLMKEAKFGPYAEPMPRPPFFFTAGQWLTLTLLVTAILGVLGFFIGLLIWG